VADSYLEDVLLGFALAIVLTVLAAIGAATWWLIGGQRFRLI
jgi:heme/copper-type cytochrome/quinol oxidase subunit 4